MEVQSPDASDKGDDADFLLSLAVEGEGPEPEDDARFLIDNGGNDDTTAALEQSPGIDGGDGADSADTDGQHLKYERLRGLANQQHHQDLP